ERLPLPGEVAASRRQTQEQVEGRHQKSSTLSARGMGTGGSVRSHWARGQPVSVSMNRAYCCPSGPVSTEAMKYGSVFCWMPSTESSQHQSPCASGSDVVRDAPPSLASLISPFSVISVISVMGIEFVGLVGAFC